MKADKLVGFTNLDGHSPRDVAKFFVDLLPALCDHLEATSAYFQVSKHFAPVNISTISGKYFYVDPA